MGLLDKPKAWPDAPAEKGKSYGVMDPVFKKQMLAVMTMETWTEFGTKFQEMQRLIAKQAQILQQMQVTNDVLVKQLADVQTKHTNLREAVRKERTQKATGEKSSGVTIVSNQSHHPKVQ